MLMTAVVHPNAFNSSQLETPHYRDQVIVMLRGLEANGLLLIDPDRRLIQEINAQVIGINSRFGQEIQVRVAELLKDDGHRRFIVANRATFNHPHLNDTLDIIKAVHSSLNADTLIIDSESFDHLTSGGAQVANITPINQYITSKFEQARNDSFAVNPFINQVAPNLVNDKLKRILRFSKRLRFYDKQIGAGNVGGFHRGIGHVLSIWVRNAYFPQYSLKAEIYTCRKQTNQPTDIVYNKIINNLVKELVSEYKIPITLYFKEDTENEIHDRYLQTDSVNVAFSWGFDFIKKNGIFRRCTIKIDNGADTYLGNFRMLKDYQKFSPRTLSPHGNIA